MNGGSHQLKTPGLDRKNAPTSPKSAPRHSCSHRPSALAPTAHQAAPCCGGPRHARSRPSSTRNVAGGSTQTATFLGEDAALAGMTVGAISGVYDTEAVFMGAFNTEEAWLFFGGGL